MIDDTRLNWTPIILLASVTLHPLLYRQKTIPYVERVYLAEHPQGVVMAHWDTPADERRDPRIRLIHWRPDRTAPFVFPTRYRLPYAGASSPIPDGAWLLPYAEASFVLYLHAIQQLEALCERMVQAPQALETLHLLERLNQTLSE